MWSEEKNIKGVRGEKVLGGGSFSLEFFRNITFYVYIVFITY